MKKDSLWVELELETGASPEKVWQALTRPELTEKYMYGCQFHSSLALGDDVAWVRFDDQGNEITEVKGIVVACVPNKILHLKLFHNKGLSEDTSELIFSIEPKADQAILKIQQGDFFHFDNSVEVYKKTLEGWNFVKKDLIATCKASP